MAERFTGERAGTLARGEAEGQSLKCGWRCTVELAVLLHPAAYKPFSCNTQGECITGQLCTLPLPNRLLLLLPSSSSLPPTHISLKKKKIHFCHVSRKKKYSAITHFYSIPFIAYRKALHIKK